MTYYDLCVIGAGMIGSAAARHASFRPGYSVCLIGPEEPKDKSEYENRDIFGAHYDEGRITRSCDQDPVWAILAQKSISRYMDIEQRSGIKFYNEVGNLMLGTIDKEFIKNVEDVARQQMVDVHHLQNESLKNKFPYFKISHEDKGVYEEVNAGNISPRKLVKAQKLIAARQGCSMFDDVVSSVNRVVQSDGSYIMKIVTESCKEIYARSVLLATGAFTEFRSLLPGINPDQCLYPLTVALVELGDSDIQRLRNMPSVVYHGQGHKDWYNRFPRNKDDSFSFYMLPPVQYPNGKFYIKLGHFHDSIPKTIQNVTEMKSWYRHGDPQLSEDTAKFIVSLFKGLPLNNWHGDSCVIVATPTNRPYIDMVHDQLGVAICGNGYAAKSSDEIGRLASEMMSGKWDSEIPRGTFKLIIRKCSSIVPIAKL